MVNLLGWRVHTFRKADFTQWVLRSIAVPDALPCPSVPALGGWVTVVSFVALGFQLFLDNRIVLALVYASCHLPFTIYLLSSYFRTLPKGFEEAAYIDGCGYFKTMVKIMIPMAKPSIITVLLFNFLTFWNEYIIAYTLMDEHGTLAMGLQNLMAVERTATNYGIMYAGLVIVMLPVLIFYICVQKRLTEGMTLGGLKG